MQEGVAIVLALIVLVATFVVATTSVTGGTASPVSRTDIVAVSEASRLGDRCDQPDPITVVADGVAAADHVCSFGPSSHPSRSG